MIPRTEGPHPGVNGGDLHCHGSEQFPTKPSNPETDSALRLAAEVAADDRTRGLPEHQPPEQPMGGAHPRRAMGHRERIATPDAGPDGNVERLMEHSRDERIPAIRSDLERIDNARLWASGRNQSQT
jgi:hypothetical protein